METHQGPVILLIYANTPPALTHLEPEVRAIAAHLSHCDCEVLTIPAATLDDVITSVSDPTYRDRICVIHYAGHANGVGVQLQTQQQEGSSGQQAFMSGLAKVLGKLPQLHLLFLNGCDTQSQTLDLFQVGIPLAIATSAGVPDAVARTFAERFYKGLTQDKSILEAFDDASAAGEADNGDPTSTFAAHRDVQSSAAASHPRRGWPWALYGPRGDRKWSLRGWARGGWSTQALREDLDGYLRQAVADFELRTFAGPQPRSRPRQEQPYKFLSAFDVDDADFFFGREAAVQGLCAAVLRDRLTVLHAPSGAGKTSLLRAGLGRRLIQDGMLPLYARTRTHKDPAQAVKRALAPPSRGMWPALLAEISLRDYLGMVCAGLRYGRELILILDQFEEVFTLAPPEDQRQAFFAELADCYADMSLPVRIILSVRKDYLSDMSRMKAGIPTVLHNDFLLPAMQRPEAAQAVTGPLGRLAEPVGCDPALLERLLDDLARGGMQLPQLQIVCTRLFEKLGPDRQLRLSAYEALGGAQGVLTVYLREMLGRLSAAERELAHQLLSALVTSEGTKRPQTLDELCGQFSAPRPEVEGVLSRLVEYRLLQRDDPDDLADDRLPRSGGLAYELTHDCMAAEVRRCLTVVPPSAKQIATVADALCDGFNYSSLRRMCMLQLDVDLDRIPPVVSMPFPDVALHLTRHFAAQPEGLRRLLSGARADNPGNPVLAQVAGALAGIPFAILPLPANPSEVVPSPPDDAEEDSPFTLEQLSLLEEPFMQAFGFNELERLLRFSLDDVLDHIVPTRDRTLPQVVRDLLHHYARRPTQLDQLLTKAIEERPHNADFQRAVESFRAGKSDLPPPPAPLSGLPFQSVLTGLLDVVSSTEQLEDAVKDACGGDVLHRVSLGGPLHEMAFNLIRQCDREGLLVTLVSHLRKEHHGSVPLARAAEALAQRSPADPA